MKHFAAIVFFTIGLSPNLLYAMTRVEAPVAKNDASKGAVPSNQSGKVEAIYAGAGKIVIGGITYAYNPLSTVVTINGKRVTISDVRVGDTVQFQSATQGVNKAPLLTKLSRERP